MAGEEGVGEGDEGERTGVGGGVGGADGGGISEEEGVTQGLEG